MQKAKHIFFSWILVCLPLLISAQILVPADNAVNMSNDMQFKLTFATAPVLQNSGKISLYKSNGSLVETIDLSQMPTGTPMSATWPWTETLNGTTIRVVPVTVDGKSVYFRFSIGAMDYSTAYYITVDKAIFSNAATIGFNGITANNWSFTIRSKPATDLSYTVSADGTGDFATLQGALDFLPTGTTNAKIFIKNGTYVGLAYTRNKNNYTIEGESKTGVIIKGYNNSNLNASTHWRSVVNIQGDNINIISLTMINTTPNGGTQAEALKLNGNQCVIVNCEFYSYQDTVLIEGKVYFKDCMLEGDVDFVWGVGTVFFQSCEIRANDNGGYNVMARNDNTKHGYAFADCKITRKTSSTTTHTLGRDAGTSYPYAEIIYLNCTLGPHIPAVGWSIRNEMDASKLMFAEYRSVNESGGLINTASRHAKSKQLSTSQATQYRDLNWFFNGWTPVVPTYGVKDCAGVTGGTAFLDDCAICVGGNTGKTACVKDCNGDINGTASLDDCGVCTGGKTGKATCTGSIQGEDFCEAIAVQESSNLGFIATGYVNFDNVIGSSGTWYLNSKTTKTASVGFRFANGGTIARSMNISVNGTVQKTLTASPTGSWTTWNVEYQNLNLTTGVNKIEVTATSSDGGPNLDLIVLNDTDLTSGGCSKDCNGIIGGSAFIDNCNTCVSGNTGKVACAQDCEGNWGGTAYKDNCDVCISTTNGNMECSGFMEAENACAVDGILLEDKNTGYTGLGYVNADNTIGAGATWSVTSASAQTATLSFRYANGGTTSRDGDLYVNGTKITKIKLPATGAWTTWEMASINIDLEKGANEIILNATTDDGLANIDLLSFSAGVTEGMCVITGINSKLNAEISIYPNPTNDRISWNTEKEWILMDIQGKELAKGKGISANLSNLPNGVYYLKIDQAIRKIFKK